MTEPNRAAGTAETVPVSETVPTAAEAAAQPEDARQYVGFRVGERNFALPIEKVQEVAVLDPPTPVPDVPACIRGVCSLRGAIIPVVDLRQLLGTPVSAASNGPAQTLVLYAGERTMGCEVDAVLQVTAFTEDDIQPAPENLSQGNGRFVSGFARLGEQLWILLDVDMMLEPERLARLRPAEMAPHPTA